MALKYTGNAATFNFEGKLYARPDVYAKNPTMYDASYDSPIIGLSRERAARMSASSNLHSFEDEKGVDVLESVTEPMNIVPSDASADVHLDVPTKSKG